MNIFSLTASQEMSIGDAGITAIFGYCVVFVGLVILMVLIVCMGSLMKSENEEKKPAEKPKETKQTEEKSLPNLVPTAEMKKAPGSAGKIKLYDVPDKEAAMIMAIVADTMKKPVNELHFISIKEVK